VAVTASLRTFFAFLAVLAATAAAAARPLDDVVDSGMLRVAVYRDFFPFSYEDGGKLRGIDVEIAEGIAKSLGVKLDPFLIFSGQTLDSDLRLSLSRGDLAGSKLADLMLHVPHDKQLEQRDELIFLTAPYLEEQLSLVFDRAAIANLDDPTVIAEKGAVVEVATGGDYLLMMMDEGRYRDRLLHYPTFDQAIGAFLKGEAPVFAGDRSLIEGAIHRAGRSPDTVGIVSPQETEWMPLKWTVGGAVKTDSRDLAYAVNDALASMRETGELQRIFAGYGVTYVPPPGY
jgi:polar amino acid transport system substrate-binding protein